MEVFMAEVIRKGIDILAARRKLNLSIEGFRRLLRNESEHASKTIRRWQTGEQDVPGAVEVLVEVLLKSAEARNAAGLSRLQEHYPFHGGPGRPPEEC
jgi:DNA-binding transcriptional regulator YiaG